MNRVLMCAALVLLARPVPGAAQSVEPEPISPAPASHPAAAGEQAQKESETPRTDLFDLLSKLRHKNPPDDTESAPPEPDRGLAVIVVPILSSSPSTGFTFGAGASLEFPLGSLETTRLSHVNLAASASTRKQLGVTGGTSLYGAENHWYLDGDNHYKLTGLDTYALGTGSPNTSVRADYRSTRFFDRFYWRLAKALYGGIGFRYGRQADIRPANGEEAAWDQSPFVTYSKRYGFDLQTQTAAGPSVDFLYDSRDNATDATKGWYLGSTYQTYFKGLAGSTSTWQELILDVRTYAALTKSRSRRLAFWTYADLVTDGTGPYFSLPATGGDAQGRSGRGYTDGRFRGERLLYGEIEYRATVTKNGLVGVVAFLNATTVSNLETGERLFDVVAPAGGVGLRLLAQKRSKTNVCFDFGWGRDGSHGFYLGLGEAF